MKKLSDILNKPVLSLYEGINEGNVENVVFDKKLRKLRFLVLCNDDSGASQNLRKLPADSHITVGEHAVVIKNSTALSPLLDEELPLNNPVNSEVFDTDGKYLGLVSDGTLNDGFNLLDLSLSSAESYPVEKVLSASSGTIILSLKDKPPHTAPIKKAAKKPKAEVAAPASSEEVALPQTVIVAKDINKIYADFSYLLGRKASEDIFNQRKERIVKRNSIVTTTTLAACKKYGKLLALARICAGK